MASESAVPRPSPASIQFDFVRRVVTRDLLPRLELLAAQRAALGCGELLREPLPLDTASASLPILLPQLMRTVGTDADTFVDAIIKCSETEAQVAKILCAAAASGLGKTHLAYAVGMKHMFAVVIRVAEQSEDAAGVPRLSMPWAILDEALRKFHAPKRRVIGAAGHAIIAKQAFTLLELLLYCYADASLTAVDQAQELGISDAAQLRELVLRFNRNVTAEAIISDLFTARMAEFASEASYEQLDGSVVAVQYANNDKLKKLREDLVRRTEKLQSVHGAAGLLLCLDEANTLIGLHPTLFLHRSVFERVRVDAAEPTPLTPDGSASAAPVAPAGAGAGAIPAPAFLPPPTTESPTSVAGRPEAVEPAPRGLFSALACLLCDVANKAPWALFMTGTAFSIAQFKTTGSEFSPVRGSVEVVTPTVQLTVEDMMTILQHYWSLTPELLADEDVLGVLRSCVGRPLLFVDVVFVPLYAMVSAAARRGAPLAAFDTAAVIRTLQRAFVQTLALFKTRMEALMTSPRPLGTDTGETTLALLPVLMEAVLFRQGQLRLDSGGVLAGAIATGLVPAVAWSADAAQRSLLDLSSEPLVFQALNAALNGRIKDNLASVLRLLVPPTHPLRGSQAGRPAELLVAVDLALRTRRARLTAGAAPMTLDALLMPMFMGGADTLPEDLSAHSCRIETPVSMADADLSQCVLRRFVREDGSLDDSIVLYDLPERFGADVAFLVSFAPVAAAEVHVGTGAGAAVSTATIARAGAGTAAAGTAHSAVARQYRLVAFQMKNTASATLSRALLTLHPGTQLLRKTQRLALTSGKLAGFKLASPLNGGADYADWRDYVALVSQYPCLATDWIRVPVVARRMEAPLYAFAYEVSTGSVARKPLELACGHWTKEQQASAARSPVVLLSLDAPTWLSADMRAGLVQADENTAVMKLERSPSIWVPATVRTAAGYCAAAGGKFEMPAAWRAPARRR